MGSWHLSHRKRSTNSPSDTGSSGRGDNQHGKGFGFDPEGTVDGQPLTFLNEKMTGRYWTYQGITLEGIQMSNHCCKPETNKILNVNYN